MDVVLVGVRRLTGVFHLGCRPQPAYPRLCGVASTRGRCGHLELHRIQSLWCVARSEMFFACCCFLPPSMRTKYTRPQAHRYYSASSQFNISQRLLPPPPFSRNLPPPSFPGPRTQWAHTPIRSGATTARAPYACAGFVTLGPSKHRPLQSGRAGESWLHWPQSQQCMLPSRNSYSRRNTVCRQFVSARSSLVVYQ